MVALEVGRRLWYRMCAMDSEFRGPENIPELVPIVNSIAQGIDAVWKEHVNEPFLRYLRSNDTDRWQIFSDYSVSSLGRKNDVFAFTVVPAGRHLGPLTAELEEACKADFKRVSFVSDRTTAFLTDVRLFNVCFLLDPDRKRFLGLGRARDIMLRTITVLENREKTPRRKINVEMLKLMRQSAAAAGFNLRLLEHILLVCGFAAFLSREISVEKHPTALGWFSDRDAIAEAYNGAAIEIYLQNYADLMEPIARGWKGPEILGVNGRTPTGTIPWNDAWNRVPDHFAAVLAPLDVNRSDIIMPAKLKYRQVFHRAVIGNQNLAVINGQISFPSAAVQIGSAPRGLP
jgi:hypothetical protein